MVENRYQIKANIKSKMYNGVIPSVTANDHIIFEVTLFDDALQMTLNSSYRYTLVTMRKNNTSVIREGTLSGSVILFELGASETTTIGRVEASIQIYDADNKRISSAPIAYDVLKDFSLSGSLPADDKTLVIANELQLTSAINKSELAMARVDVLIQQTPQPNEVVDIRVRNNGTVASTAGQYVRELDAQLAEKASKEELNALGELKLSGTYATLTDLQTAFPSGATGLFLVTADGFTYRWDGSAWIKAVQFQSTGIANHSVFERHLKSNVTPVIKNQSEYTSNSNTTSLYIPNEVLSEGLVNLTFSAGTATNGFIYFLERIGTTNNFAVLDKLPYTSIIGENNIKTPFIARGNGQEYIGFIGLTVKFKSTGSTVGFFEALTYDNTTTPISASNKVTSTIDFSSYVTYSDKVIAKKVTEVKESVDSLSPPSGSKSYSVLKLRKTQGNSSVYPNAYFQGRWFPKNINGVDYMIAVNQGSEILAKFTGTSISAEFLYNATSTPYIAVSIDGGAFTRMAVYNGSYVLASGLNDGEHYIRVIADGIKESDDIWVGGQGIAFIRFTVDTGKTVTPVKPFNKKVLFLGDSIIAGIAILASGSSPANNSAQNAYPFVTCTELNLANVRVAFGGTGVTKGGSGGVPSAISYIDYVIQGIEESAEEPDFIVINHGTNDHAADSATFQTAYREVIKRLNIKYPGIPIICMRTFNGTHATSIKTVAEEFSNCFYVDTSTWGVTYTDGVHPDVAGSQTAGLALAEELKKIFGLGYFIP